MKPEVLLVQCLRFAKRSIDLNSKCKLAAFQRSSLVNSDLRIVSCDDVINRRSICQLYIFRKCW